MNKSITTEPNNILYHFKHVQNNRNDNEETLNAELTDEELELFSGENIYEHLAYSIAPEIYGLSDVKKSLLLALVGGVNNNANGFRGKRIKRDNNNNYYIYFEKGALNILLVGDPGVAKSHLLTYVDRLAFRSQYTRGSGSSGVGLTATMVEDPFIGIHSYS